MFRWFFWAGLRIVVCCSLVGTACTRGQKDQDPPLTYHTAQPTRLKTLDPAFAEDQYSGVESARAYEGLLQYHYLKRPYQLIPALAESMPEVSPDGLTYTFRIRQGVYFHQDPCFGSGPESAMRELTAQDFVYSWKRVADPFLLSPGWMYLADLIQGLDEWREKSSRSGSADYQSEVTGLKALDRHVLQVKLKHPLGLFLNYLATSFLKVVPREAVQAYGREFGLHAVGTGPFRLKELRVGHRLVWDRNPSFRKEYYPSEGTLEDQKNGLLKDAGQPLPLVDRVVVNILTEAQPMWLSFLKGKLDIQSPPKDAYAQAFTLTKELVPELKAKGMAVVKSQRPDVTFVSFNMRHPILGKNRKLRQALSLAYNQSEFSRIFFNDRAVIAQGPIPPGVVGHDPKLRGPYRQFQLSRARALLAEAGFPGGKGLPELEYLTVADTDGRHIAEFIVRSFQALGVRVKIVALSWPELLKAIGDGRAQMAGHAWNADYPDGQNFLQLFYSRNAPPAGNNSAFYSNPEFDALYEKALRLAPGRERQDLYNKMIAIVLEDCPWIFGSHRVSFTLVQPWISNYKPNDFERGPSKYYRVIPELKTKWLENGS